MSNNVFDQLARCDREIANAVEESQLLHTESEHVGILLWEMDWRAERERILAEIVAESVAA